MIFHAEHHHPRDPKENDVEAGDQEAGRIVTLEVGGLIGPSEGREGPQSGGEPGVEHVIVLTKLAATAFGAGLRWLFGDDWVEGFAVIAPPGGNAMAPPELARDAPVLNIAHPREVGIFPSLREELGLLAFDRLDCLTGERLALGIELVDREEPLIGEHRLNDGVAARADPDRMLMRICFFKQSIRF